MVCEDTDHGWEVIGTMDNISESRKEWLLDKFSFEAKRTRRAENYKVWKDDNHAIDLSHIDLMEKVNYIHNKSCSCRACGFS